MHSKKKQAKPFCQTFFKWLQLIYLEKLLQHMSQR
jgi:hypothetical protein